MQQSPSKNDEVEKALEKFEQGVQARNRAGYEELQNADIAIAAAVSSFPSLYNPRNRYFTHRRCLSRRAISLVAQRQISLKKTLALCKCFFLAPPVGLEPTTLSP